MIGLGTGSAVQNRLRLDYAYGELQPNGTIDATKNNGNLTRQTITVPTVITGGTTHMGFTAVQNYQYDSLNRLKQATENISPNGGSQTLSWRQTYTFDRYGNRRFDTANTTTIPAGCLEPVCNPQIDPATNKLIGYQFDNAGNTKTDANGQIFIYDGENKQTEVRTATNAVVGQYFYNGDGQRIKKIVPSTGETTVFVYDASGKSIAEYSTVVESAENAKVAYLTSDHLGSPRINTDRDGNVTSRRDFHPFGEEIYTAERTTGLAYDADTIRKRFTGYERDTETDLDFAQARMFGSSHGRFTSPDDFLNDTHVSDPQSWNLYSYVRNNPVRFVDPSGEKARIYARYDDATKTMHINIQASFAIYGAEGQGITQEELNKQKALLIEGLTREYGKSFEEDGITYSLSADIQAIVVGSEAEAIESGVDNIVEIGNQALIGDDGKEAQGMAFRVKGESFDRMVMSTSSHLRERSLNLSGVYAHEFGHLLGVGHTGRSLFGPEGTTNRMLRMSFDDFKALFPKNGVWGVRGDSSGVVKTGPYTPNSSSIRKSKNPTFELRRAASERPNLVHYSWQRRN